MKKEEHIRFRQEVDAWIKGFRKELQDFSADVDDVDDEVKSHSEELQFQFENLCRIESRIDKLEETFERILDEMNAQSGSLTRGKSAGMSNIEVLRDKF